MHWKPLRQIWQNWKHTHTKISWILLWRIDLFLTFYTMMQNSSFPVGLLLFFSIESLTICRQQTWHNKLNGLHMTSLQQLLHVRHGFQNSISHLIRWCGRTILVVCHMETHCNKIICFKISFKLHIQHYSITYNLIPYRLGSKRLL